MGRTSTTREHVTSLQKGNPRALPVSADEGPSPAPQPQALFTGRASFRKPPANARQQRVADLAIGRQLLFPVTVGAGRIVRRPVFDVGGKRSRQVERLVMRLRRE